MRPYLLGLATLPAIAVVVLAWSFLFERSSEWQDCWCAPGEPSGREKYPHGTSWSGRRWRWWRHTRSLRHRAWLRSRTRTRAMLRDRYPRPDVER